MDPVSNVDQLVLLLRQRLQERSRISAPTRRSAPGKSSLSPLENLQALAGLDGVEERQLQRAFVQSLLVDQFGKGPLNDAKFQQVVDRVTDALSNDARASRLLGRVLNELRASAG